MGLCGDAVLHSFLVYHLKLLSLDFGGFPVEASVSTDYLPLHLLDKLAVSLLLFGIHQIELELRLTSQLLRLGSYEFLAFDSLLEWFLSQKLASLLNGLVMVWMVLGSLSSLLHLLFLCQLLHFEVRVVILRHLGYL